jgi:aminoglycoside 3-N-acetyltransferase I
VTDIPRDKMQTEIKILSHDDIREFTELIDVFECVFEMKNFSKPSNDYLHNILTKPNFFVLIAKANSKVVGGLTVYVLDQYYSKKPLAYIYDLAVLKDFQRQGIGRSLIKHLTEYCKKEGFDEVFVQADRIDDYALDFYRMTKPTNEEDVIHFYYSLQDYEK